jgi:hypothetical protein
LKKWDPCWRLFTYNAILNESRYLSKAVKGIIAAVRSAHHHELDIKTDMTNTSLDVNVSLVDAIRSLVKTMAPPDAGEFGQLLGCLTQLESDVNKASEFVNGTIGMVGIVMFCAH